MAEAPERDAPVNASASKSPSAAAPAPPPEVWKIVRSPNVQGSPLNQPLALAAISSRDIWAVGFHGTIDDEFPMIMHWNGNEWKLDSNPNPADGSGQLYDVEALSGSVSVAVGHQFGGQALAMRWNGSGWTRVANVQSSGAELDALTAVTTVRDSRSELLAVGYSLNRSSAHRTLIMSSLDNGNSWQIVPSPNPGMANSNELNGVAARPSGKAWAVGYFRGVNGVKSPLVLIRETPSSQWRTELVPSPGTLENNLSAVAAVSDDEVWAVGSSINVGSIPQALILRRKNGIWTHLPAPPSKGGSSSELISIAVVEPTYIWAAGNYWDAAGITKTLIMRWDGNHWSVLPSENAGTDRNILRGVLPIPGSTFCTGGESWAVGWYWNPSIGGFQTLTERYIMSIHHGAPCPD